MSTFQDQIKELEDQIKRTKINKATEKHVGLLKAKIARLKREQQDRLMGGGSGGGDGYDVKKSGDSSVALIGLPSVGKSTLLNQLINQKISQVGSYAFTTLEAIPGIMSYEGASIQIIDLPGIISGASKGKGQGKRVLGVARGADLLLIVLDVFSALHHFELIINELSYVGIRLNQEAPDVVIKKTNRGGIGIASLKILTKIDDSTIKSIMNEYRLINANITIRSDISDDQLIDVLEGNRVYIPAFIVLNKIDLVSDLELREVKEKLNMKNIGISAESGKNIDELKKIIFNYLSLIRIYLKPYGMEADFEEPLIIRNGADVGDVCDKLHNSFRKEFHYARVWGKSVKHSGQKVSIKHKMEDGDVLTIVRKTN
ncbi:MAG: GTP-binding protein [Candidatus Heimdallarchaeota archaeon]|nr:GTP-binding protein [Candidatus Heimdallarchaeota archaeon]MDH5646129.1 GTP-binding protein [Candidatus Heimdallarchaeota archaeon]